jgi:hypothetical protein
MNAFASKVSLIFKQYDHDILKGDKNYTFYSSYDNKKYAIICEEKKDSSEILCSNNLNNKIEQAKNSDLRLIIVCASDSSDDNDMASELGFCLLSIKTLEKYYKFILNAL